MNSPKSVSSCLNCRSTQSGSWQATLLGAVSCGFSWPAPSNWNHGRLPRKSIWLDGHLLLPQVQKYLGYSEKPINDFQSLSRKPVNDNVKVKQYFLIKCCNGIITPADGLVKRKLKRFGLAQKVTWCYNNWQNSKFESELWRATIWPLIIFFNFSI